MLQARADGEVTTQVCYSKKREKKILKRLKEIKQRNSVMKKVTYENSQTHFY